MAPQVVITKQDLIDRNEARFARAQYRETHALLINWGDDDLKAKSDTRGLEFVMRDSYAIITRLITIPSRDYMEENLPYFKDTGRTFKRELDEFIRLYSAPDILLLVIYLGRGHYDKDLVFTLRGFGKATSKGAGKVMPQVRWAVAESGLLEAESDVVMLFDLRGDEGDNEPVVMFDTSHIAKQDSINKLIISYSAPGTPGDSGKSFAYTKLLRDYLRNMSTTPFVMFDGAHNHVVTQIHAARDHGGLAFAPFCHNFSSVKSDDIPLIAFDVAYPSVNILKGVGDYKWGPLGCLPAGWEKSIDNNDSYWRTYYQDPHGMKHATRSWATTCRVANEFWDAIKFAHAGQQNVYARLTAAQKHAPKALAKGSSEWFTASHDFSIWMAAVISKREEAAVKEKTEKAIPEEATRQDVARQEAADQEAARQEAARQEARHQKAIQQEVIHQEAPRREAMHEEALRQAQEEAISQEAIRQQALEQATRQEIARQGTVQGEAFRKQQEDQYALQRLDASHRLEAKNRFGGVTGLSASKYASNVNIPVRGRGPFKLIPGQVSISYAAQEKQVPVKVETIEIKFSQTSGYPVAAREVEVQQVVVQTPPVKIEAPQVKIEIPQFKVEAPKVKVEAQQPKTETPTTAGMNAWQAYLAQARR